MSTGKPSVIRFAWKPGLSRRERWERRMRRFNVLRFWRAWLAGKFGVTCLRVHAFGLAKKCADYERAEGLRVANRINAERAMEDAEKRIARQIGEELDQEVIDLLSGHE